MERQMPKNLDPTKTTLLRRRFVTETKRRITTFKNNLKRMIVELDVFGLDTDTGIISLNQVPREYAYLTDTQKVARFQDWVEEDLDREIMDYAGILWMAPYMEQAYRRGVINSYSAVRSRAKIDTELEDVTRDQFIQMAMAAAVAGGALDTANQRVLIGLRGYRDAVVQELSRTLSDGMARGLGTQDMYDAMENRVNAISNRRAIAVARSEIVRTHAEAQLDVFASVGIGLVAVSVEWVTVGDNRVCERCASMEGTVLTIPEARGLIPRHPMCRCAWLPANVGESRRGQIRGAEVADAVEESIEADTRLGRTNWLGRLL
jgi:SPP1 gp7 family putative phage head morphogenesis protein